MIGQDRRAGRGVPEKTHEDDPWARLLPVAAWALAAPCAVLGYLPRSLRRRSQEQIIVREVRVGQAAESPAEQDADEAAPANGAMMAMQAGFVMTDDQFDQWVFGAPRNPRAGRNKLDSLLTFEVDDVARTCRLSEVQKKKLLLAGRGDIKRFFDKVEEKRKKFDKVKTDQNKIGEIYQELVPLQATLNSGSVQRGLVLRQDLQDGAQSGRGGTLPEGRRREEPIPVSRQGGARGGQLDQSVGFRDDPAAAARGPDLERDQAAQPGLDSTTTTSCSTWPAIFRRQAQAASSTTGSGRFSSAS